MARFAVVQLPKATAPIAPAMTMLREVAGRLQAKVKQSTQAINRLHILLARVFPELAQPHRRSQLRLGVAPARRVSYRPARWPGPAHHPAEDSLPRPRTGRATATARPTIGGLPVRRCGGNTSCAIWSRRSATHSAPRTRWAACSATPTPPCRNPHIFSLSFLCCYWL